ncbi:Dabb family protein [Flexithrix dorotheae]|uniref:Dabb family protein n=1 Tax=Flexithrix dorotheae TaxID=70993 RepID=UPI000361EBF0|nr:Dabb family protein [Flexithrix dorotheae]
MKKMVLNVNYKIVLAVLAGLFVNLSAAFPQNMVHNCYTSLVPLDSAKTTNNTVTAFAYQKEGLHLVFTGGDGGFLDVFSLSDKGMLQPLATYELYNKKGPARGLVADNIGGKDFLFVGNKGGNAVEVFEIEDDGQLQRVFLLKDTEETHLGTVITLKVVHMKKASYLFVGGLENTPGLSCFEIQKNGKLNHVQSLKDDDTIHTDGIIGMYAHNIEGKTFLFTGGFQDNGISSFRVFENGHFENVSNISDNVNDRYLTGTYPVDGVTLGSNHYVIVGHRHHKYYKRTNFIKKKDFVYHGDGVSVFKVSPEGHLIPHDVLIDNDSTLLAGQTRIEVLQVNEKEAIVTIGTRDDNSIQVCRMGEDGLLKPSGGLNTGYPIYYGMASHKIGEDLYFLAGSVSSDVKKLFSYTIKAVNQMVETAPQKVLRHIVNLKFKEEVSQERIEIAVKDFINLQQKIPEIIGFEWGINNSEEGHSKGFTHGFTLTFKDEEAREIYLKHKDHLALVEKVGPILEDVFVMDYWTNSDF